MDNFIQITPFMHVEDFEGAVRFFEDILGFKAWIHVADYAYLQRECAGIRILKASSAVGEKPHSGTRAFRYYIDVKDVDRLFAELKPKLDPLPAGSVHGPVNQSYGQREFMVLAPDGDLVVFGQSIFEMQVNKYDPEV